ncbi:MAG TPA: hypothetical protein VEZ40_05590 [Pyrinomonadaceae bacterium]|nr:hypothetical protein [Pyrinomonadaceae bacterium]
MKQNIQYSESSGFGGAIFFKTAAAAGNVSAGYQKLRRLAVDAGREMGWRCRKEHTGKTCKCRLELARRNIQRAVVYNLEFLPGGNPRPARFRLKSLVG